MAIGRVLFVAILVSVAGSASAWQYDWNYLEQWLNAYGYSAFADALKQTHLPNVIVKLAENGYKITIMAPNNYAFSKYNGPQCCMPLDTVLSLHILNGQFTGSMIGHDNIGHLYPTGTAVPLAKKSQSPLRVGVETGFLQYQSSAKVCSPDAYVTPDGVITVHGIDSVLQYPCYSRFY